MRRTASSCILISGPLRHRHKRIVNRWPVNRRTATHSGVYKSKGPNECNSNRSRCTPNRVEANREGRKRTLSNQQLGLMLCLAIASCSWLKRNSTPRPRTALLNTITTRRAPKGLENVEQNKMVDHERRHGETMNYFTLTFQKAAVAVQGMSREIKKSINTTSPFRGRKKSQARNETTDKKSHGRVVFLNFNILAPQEMHSARQQNGNWGPPRTFQAYTHQR